MASWRSPVGAWGRGVGSAILSRRRPDAEARAYVPGIAGAEPACAISSSMPASPPSAPPARTTAPTPAPAGRVHGPKPRRARCRAIPTTRRPRRAVHQGVALPERTTTRAVLRPLRRVGPKGQRALRPVSWDAALAEIAGALRHRRARPEAIVPYSYAGTMGLVRGEHGGRFFHRLGASLLDRTICASAGGGRSPPPTAARSACTWRITPSKLILIWGSNSIASTCTSGLSRSRPSATAPKLICIDPRKTETADKCHQHRAAARHRRARWRWPDARADHARLAGPRLHRATPWAGRACANAPMAWTPSAPPPRSAASAPTDAPLGATTARRRPPRSASTTAYSACGGGNAVRRGGDPHRA